MNIFDIDFTWYLYEILHNIFNNYRLYLFIIISQIHKYIKNANNKIVVIQQIIQYPQYRKC
jgi:hypothetical protein